MDVLGYAPRAPRSPALPADLIFNLEPGMHADGQGLYLKVTESLGRSWVLVFHQRGKRREMGLGSARTVTLSEAREQADIAKRQIMFGRDPIAMRRSAHGRRSSRVGGHA